MENGNFLLIYLNSLEERMTEALLLIQLGFNSLRTDPEIRNRMNFNLIFEGLGYATTAIIGLRQRCFQPSTGLCVVCERFSDYHSLMKKALYEIACLVIFLNAQHHRYFPHLYANAPNFIELLVRLDAANDRQLQLDEDRPSERCGCVQLPHGGLELVYNISMEISSQI